MFTFFLSRDRRKKKGNYVVLLCIVLASNTLWDRSHIERPANESLGGQTSPWRNFLNLAFSSFPRLVHQQQGSDLPHGVRLWHLSPVAIKRYVALTTSIVVYVSIQTWGYVEPSNTAFTSNPSVAFGNLEQNFPREVALSSTGVAATQDLTGDSLSNLPWWASSSQREKT